ncbi:MAG: vWA domain-containing protein, partial [Verrucomicrobiota bacterium]
MVAEWISLIVMILFAGGEWMHARRCRRVARLAFGPTERPSPLGKSAPVLNVLAAGLLCWGLLTLLFLPPKSHVSGLKEEEDAAKRHVLLLLDVSPSMRLQDAGPDQDQSRTRRAAAVMNSFFSRVPPERYRISIVAFYTGAKPVVLEGKDMEVIANILNDLPMHYAFEKGETDLFLGIEEAAKIAHRWNPGSTTMLLVSDGDSVPAKGMPRLPVSIADIIVAGIGDPITGKFIDGRQSRQDASTLRQVAVRLGGQYHNANEKHLPSDLLEGLAVRAEASWLEELTRREYALIAVVTVSAILAFLPLLL